jgi:nitronate monooxygenase
VLNNEVIRTWMGRESDLRTVRDAEAARYREAAKAGDANVAATIVGEAIGLIDAIEPAGEIVGRMAAGAEALLKRGARIVQ